MPEGVFLRERRAFTLPIGAFWFKLKAVLACLRRAMRRWVSTLSSFVGNRYYPVARDVKCLSAGVCFP